MNHLIGKRIAKSLFSLILIVSLSACGTSQATLPVQPTQGSVALPTAAQAQPTQAASTPAATQAAACASPAKLTPALTEGPYFKVGSPERASLLEANTSGTHLVISGRVLNADCQPVAGALLDFWQADANGAYDNSGYTMRGHQLTDASGNYQLTSVVPGLYTGRTEHIHVKVQAPGGPVLTTQLFFPGVAQNDSDGIFDPALLMAVQTAADGQTASFDFVINVK